LKFVWRSADYTALYPRRQNSSWPPLWEPQILHSVRLWRGYSSILSTIREATDQEEQTPLCLSLPSQVDFQRTTRYIPEDRTLQETFCTRTFNLVVKYGWSPSFLGLTLHHEYL
jgi:hypothetical protein